MARKTKVVGPLDLGEDFPRDNGKVFVITEMSALAAERWATRAFLALARSGIDVPEGIEKLGFAGIAILGLRSLGGVIFEEIDPLMTEMLECVQIRPDPAQSAIYRGLYEDDIEEVSTLLYLRREVFDLHSNFSQLAARYLSTSETGETT